MGSSNSSGSLIALAEAEAVAAARADAARGALALARAGEPRNAERAATCGGAGGEGRARGARDQG